MPEATTARAQFHELHPSLSTWMTALDRRLASLFDGEHSAIYEAGVAVVRSRGKRLRPALLLLSCACFGDVSERALTGGALVELIHSASLIHDDVVDDADSRRGAPSAPARWGKTFSVLLGDYLFARVFELAAEDGDPTLLRLLANTSTEMGRAIILEYRSLDLNASEEVYERVIRGKTAALFGASAGIGALIGGAGEGERLAMQRMGEAFGCAFQLADDLLDLQGSEEDTGKPLGVDWRQRRATLPLLHVLRHAPSHVADDIRALWLQEPFTPEHHQALYHLVEAHGGFDCAWGKVKDYLADADAHLAGIPAGAARDTLARLCRDAFPLPVMPEW